MGGASRRYRCECAPAAGRGGRSVDSIAVARNACPAADGPSKKVRVRIGSVPVSLREDAPNGPQRRITRRLTTAGASPLKSLKRRLGR
ncbi:hypothetical protein D1006_06385 [Burkholderia stabilis]|uniref:Uncharacterized protein n=1 Tax=Burkholderia stabilis TaxID=95485 RepID=A0A4Q2ATT9_9BURK|nr:hypothetical protein D1006_06385 [Burkholderia stabilis]